MEITYTMMTRKKIKSHIDYYIINQSFIYNFDSTELIDQKKIFSLPIQFTTNKLEKEIKISFLKNLEIHL